MALQVLCPGEATSSFWSLKRARYSLHVPLLLGLLKQLPVTCIQSAWPQQPSDIFTNHSCGAEQTDQSQLRTWWRVGWLTIIGFLHKLDPQLFKPFTGTVDIRNSNPNVTFGDTIPPKNKAQEEMIIRVHPSAANGFQNLLQNTRPLETELNRFKIYKLKDQ